MSVRFEGVTKFYGEVGALVDFSLDIADGEFLVLVGPSGCGKTTALRVLAGLEEPAVGDVYIDDRAVTELQPSQRDVAVVFQNYALYPHMSVYDNIAFGLRTRKIPRRDIDQSVREAAELLGLSALLKRKPGQLSGGQRQRVALGRAIVRRPKAFLMDEPLSNLDAKLRAQTRLELIRLHRRLHTTVLYVTHDQVEAMTMGERIAIMDRGRLQQVGTAQDVYERPANLFVAEFIGSPAMSFFQGEMRTAADGALAIVADAATFSLTAEQSAFVRQSGVRSLTVGVRPEHLDPAEEYGERSVATTFSAVVDVVESLGNEVHATLLVGSRTIVARINPEQAPITGQTRQFAVAQEHLHLFDTETGRRLE
jgi:multiple sugar transport system ATP-binding protein